MAKYEEIDNLKKELDSYRPFSMESLKSLRENISLKWTYNSNAIEGNSLTLRETQVVLEGITVGGKSLREHLEAVNHLEAINYVYDIIENKEGFSEWTIKNIHQLVLKGIDRDNAGKYRNVDVYIKGSEFKPPNHYLVKGQIEKMMEWHKNSDLHPIEKAARLHTDFVQIHPFVDGNGRTARLLLNFELMKNDYVPIIIKNEKRLDYYHAIREADSKGDYKDIYNLVAGLEKEMLINYLSIFKSNKKDF